MEGELPRCITAMRKVCYNGVLQQCGGCIRAVYYSDVCVCGGGEWVNYRGILQQYGENVTAVHYCNAGGGGGGIEAVLQQCLTVMPRRYSSEVLQQC